MSMSPARNILLVAALFAYTGLGHAELLAGAAKRSIVPPFPTHMGGFGDRMETFTGVHDELFARALVLDDGTTPLIVIGSDLMAIDESLVRIARDGIVEKTGVPRENILISCSHNHSAPSYYQKVRAGEDNPPLEAFLAEQFVAAAVDAYSNRVPAEAGFRAGSLPDTTRNRQQDNEIVIDPQVGVLRVEEKEGREIIAILYNFTGHPVILGSRNLELSAEYPGAASRTIESVLGGVAVFTQGAAGDVTVHRQGDPFLEIERLGRVLAGEVIQTAEMIRPTAEVPLAVDSASLTLDAIKFPNESYSAKMIEYYEGKLEELASVDPENRELRGELQNRLRLHRGLLARAPTMGDFESGNLPPHHYNAEVQVMTIGDLAIATMPGEVFVEYALELRQRAKQVLSKDFMFVGYANGYIGYIVTPRAAVTGGYEASVARVVETSGRTMTEKAMELLMEFEMER